METKSFFSKKHHILHALSSGLFLGGRSTAIKGYARLRPDIPLTPLYLFFRCQGRVVFSETILSKNLHPPPDKASVVIALVLWSAYRSVFWPCDTSENNDPR